MLGSISRFNNVKFVGSQDKVKQSISQPRSNSPTQSRFNLQQDTVSFGSKEKTQIEGKSYLDEDAFREAKAAANKYLGHSKENIEIEKVCTILHFHTSVINITKAAYEQALSAENVQARIYEKSCSEIEHLKNKANYASEQAKKYPSEETYDYEEEAHSDYNLAKKKIDSEKPEKAYQEAKAVKEKAHNLYTEAVKAREKVLKELHGEHLSDETIERLREKPYVEEPKREVAPENRPSRAVPSRAEIEDKALEEKIWDNDYESRKRAIEYDLYCSKEDPSSPDYTGM